MGSLRIVAVWVGILLLGTILYPVVGSQTQDPPSAPEVGALAPDFTLPDVDGKTLRLSTFRGKVVFLDFWASWCPACQFEMPTMEVVYQQFKDRGFVILAVSIEQGSQTMVKRAALAFREQYGPLTFPLLLDPKQNVMDRYRVAFIPTHFYIDRKGRIRDKGVGPKDWRKPENRKVIEGLLHER